MNCTYVSLCTATSGINSLIETKLSSFYDRLPHCRGATSYKIVRTNRGERASNNKKTNKQYAQPLNFVALLWEHFKLIFHMFSLNCFFYLSRRKCWIRHIARVQSCETQRLNTRTHSNEKKVWPKIHALFKRKTESLFRFPFRVLYYLWMTKILSLRLNTRRKGKKM